MNAKECPGYPEACEAKGLNIQENVILMKFRQAKGHRVSMAIMLHTDGSSCDIAIEDRVRFKD